MNKMRLRLANLRNTSGQNFVEYALMAGFVAASVCAVMPDVAYSVSTVFSQVGSVMGDAASQGGGTMQTTTQTTTNLP